MLEQYRTPIKIEARETEACPPQPRLLEAIAIKSPIEWTGNLTFMSCTREEIEADEV